VRNAYIAVLTLSQHTPWSILGKPWLCRMMICLCMLMSLFEEKRSNLSERSTLNKKAGSMPPCRHCICTINELRDGETPKSILAALCQNRRLTSVVTLTASLACSFLSIILSCLRRLDSSLHRHRSGRIFFFSPPIQPPISVLTH
jgi:hypothetical protein